MMPMTNKGHQNGSIASSSRQQANLENHEDFSPILEDMNIDVSDDEIHDEVADNPVVQSENDQPYELPVNDNRRKRKYSFRHTKSQIKELEAFYNICPNPNEKQRKELAQELGLNPSQVKFWFQNKRTQIKTHHAHEENIQLRAENEILCCENMKLKQSLSLCSCIKCGAHVLEMPPNQHQLTLENERLREKIEHVTAITESIIGFISKLENIPFGDIARRNQLLRSLDSTSELKKALIIEIAVSAMKEVDSMARIGEPLWIPDLDRNTLVLNPHEYSRAFRRSFPPKQAGFRSESSLASAVVIMNPLELVEIFMGMNKWLAVFSGMISKAMLLEVLSSGVAEGNYNGALKLISAEFQALSPAIPTRDCVFVRYCRQLGEATWAIADISIDALYLNESVARCQRKPSGCIIQAMPNNCSQITWVEHVEVQDYFTHDLSRSIINSGYAYGAKRWVTTLQRQCERIASALGIIDYPYFEDLNDIVLGHPDGKQSVLKLAERMILRFYSGITAFSSNYDWEPVHGNGIDEVRIMTRNSQDDLGTPNGLMISASGSFWIPVAPKTVFNYLRNGKNRVQWDILSMSGGVQEIVYIGNGQEKNNRVSILRVDNPHTSKGSMVILQECSSEPTASLIVYAPVDIVSISTLLRGGDPDIVELLPCGFTIIPSGPPGYEGGVDDDGITNGTLLSIAFQILGDSDSKNFGLSAATIDLLKDLVKSTIRKIQNALCVLDSDVHMEM